MTKYEEFIDAHRDEIIADWRDLVNLEGKAEELDNLAKTVEWIKEKFTEAGFSCELHKTVDGAPMVLTGILGEERPGKPVLLMGHYDTVFKKGMFGDLPFRIDEQGKAHGPGCLDMKGGIVMALWIAKALEADGYKERPLKIAFAGDEEGGKYHSYASPFYTESAKGCACALNFETGPVNGSVCTGRKGAWVADFEIHGVAAHSGNNWDAGRNAVVDAAYKIVEIDKLSDVALGTNMTVAVVNGGKMWNQVPDYCKVTLSCRFAKESETKRVMDAVKKIVATPYVEGTWSELHDGGSGAVFEETETNLNFWKFVNSIGASRNMEIGHVFLGGGSDAVSASKAGVPTLCSCGVRGEWNHTDREYAIVDSMFVWSKLWCNVIEKLDDFHA